MQRPFILSLLLVLAAACGEEKLVDRPPDPPIAEFLPQDRASQIDILFVVDNSDSMNEERASLAQNFDRFLEYLDPAPLRSGEPGEVDYRIAVTTTDASRSSGRLIRAKNAPDRAVLRPGAGYNPLTSMQRIIEAIPVGGALEQGFEAALLALARAADERDPVSGEAMFLRPNAWLYVIVVTDEDDFSFGEVRYYHRRFETLKGVGNENAVAFSAIAGPLPDGCGSEAQAGERYAELAELTGGVLGSICTEDWGATLEELAITGIGLRKRFQLERIPNDLTPLGYGPEDFVTLQVHYPCDYDENDPHLSSEVCAEVTNTCGQPDGALTCLPFYAEEDGWTFDERENAIVFHGAAIPGPGSTVEVRYHPRDS